MIKSRKGFTLVELIVVLLIIGIISVIAVPNINSFRKNLKEKSYNKRISLIKLAAENYALDNKNKILEQCENGTLSCSTCEEGDCYVISVDTNTLRSNGSIKETDDFDDINVNVKLSGNNYSNIKAESVNVTKININAVKYFKDKAEGKNPESQNEFTIEGNTQSCTNTLAYDGTDDKNLRYVGKNPCNYVTFNGESAGWRIIGLMNNIDDGTGNKETRIKLIRTDYLGGKFAWDTAQETAPGGTSGWGKNYWYTAKIMEELNGDFLNYNLDTDPYWYTGPNLEKNAQFDHTKVLKQEAQSMIKDARWYLAGPTSHVYNASDFYDFERSDNVYQDREKSWVGKIALIYPSDVGFASGGENRDYCLAATLNNYNLEGNNVIDCYQTTWLQFAGLTITTQSNNYFAQFSMLSMLSSYYVHDGRGGTKPVAYLKPSVKILYGEGSKTNPYVLG